MAADTFAALMEWIAAFIEKIVALFNKLQEILAPAEETT